MIETLEDAFEFYTAREKEFASFGANVLKRRSTSFDGIYDVGTQFGLPDDYVRCARNIQMEGVTLGYFDLCPGEVGDLCLSLLSLNSAARRIDHSDRLIAVANFDADIVAVSKGDPFHLSATVFYVDVTTSAQPVISELAGNFCDFLTLASALDQSVLEGHDNPEATIMSLVLKLGHERSLDRWKGIARMVI